VTLAAYAHVWLGLDAGEFWSLTLEEFSALIEAHEAKMRLENYRAGLAPAAIYNTAMGKRNKTIQPLDFFKGRKARNVDEEVLDTIRAWREWQQSRSG
jgi:hypothetical protein